MGTSAAVLTQALSSGLGYIRERQGVGGDICPSILFFFVYMAFYTDIIKTVICYDHSKE